MLLRGGEITQINFSSNYFSSAWNLSLDVPVKFITVATYDTGGVQALVDVERSIVVWTSNRTSYRGGRFNVYTTIDDIHNINIENYTVSYLGNITISTDFKTVSGDGSYIMVSIWG